MWELWVFATLVVVVIIFIRRKSKDAPLSQKPPPRRTLPERVSTERTGLRYAVTGGHGLLGSHTVEALLARGEDNIKVIDLVDSPLFRPERDANSPTVTFVKCDITQKEQVVDALKDVDIVFHTAALVQWWVDLPHEWEPSYRVNVLGTKNLIEAARKNGVKKFIHTSSCSVFIGKDVSKNSPKGCDDSTPFPKQFLAHYMHTKYLGERLVLEANGVDGLLTAAIRPGGIYGPRDVFLVAAAMALDSPVVLAKPETVQDFVYVENVVHCFLKVEEALKQGSCVAGEAYPATDDEAGSVRDFFEGLAALFNKKVTYLSPAIIWTIAYLTHFTAWAFKGRLTGIFGLGGHDISTLRPCAIDTAQGTMWLLTDKAKKDLGWKPAYTQKEGMKKSADYFYYLRKK